MRCTTFISTPAASAGVAAQVVQSDRRQPGLSGQVVEDVRDVRRVQWRAVPLGEGEIVLFPPLPAACAVRGTCG
ncbi:hypothetical protein, partial [Amycolatopsis echigonensis]|uniref:hypothetical protein n=1 Tax=Amycolatopsis echigonensis TaxID=2576905 RepID=UPI001C7FE3B6